MACASPGRPTWLDDGRFWYRATTATGSTFYVVDPARKTREPMFDHANLAAALGPKKSDVDVDAAAKLKGAH